MAEDAADLRALDASAETVRVRGLTDADVGELRRFHQLRSLDFTGGWKAMPMRLTAAGFARLAALGLPNVQGISLAECPSLDDASLQAVARLDGLSTVGLRHSTGFSPLGLRSILDLPALTYLDLRGCSQIDDTWGDLLATGTQLRHLGITRTHMTPDGVARLRMALPDCFIDDDPAYINASLDRAQHAGRSGPPQRKGR